MIVQRPPRGLFPVQSNTSKNPSIQVRTTGNLLTFSSSWPSNSTNNCASSSFRRFSQKAKNNWFLSPTIPWSLSPRILQTSNPSSQRCNPSSATNSTEVTSSLSLIFPPSLPFFLSSTSPSKLPRIFPFRFPRPRSIKVPSRSMSSY